MVPGMGPGTASRKELTMSAKQSKQSQSAIDPRIATMLQVPSAGQSSLFVTEATGILLELKAPEANGRDATYVYRETGEVRASTWTAKVQTFDGRQVYWNWPGFINEADGQNYPGINIIQEGHTLGELLAGTPATFKRDPQSRRSTVTLIQQ